MPATVRGAVPAGTLPYSLSTKFSELRTVPININEYHDGSCQRTALVNGARRSWKLSKRLTAFQSGLLADFQNSMNGQAFYFYNPSETFPEYSHAPTGTAGRYLVRFNNDWNRTFSMGRFDSDVELIEVASDQEIGEAA